MGETCGRHEKLAGGGKVFEWVDEERGIFFVDGVTEPEEPSGGVSGLREMAGM